MSGASPGAPQTAVHVCHECLTRLPTRAGGVDLPRRIRHTLSAAGRPVPVLASGCFGLCPPGRVAACVGPDGLGQLGGEPELELDPERDGAELLPLLP
ncbi:hypothetical protein FGE12_07220 [Aggregicoccus sp. 17bor-14]|uniref:hypothetical protein n=1 Tax=Myxococcaceae TaxID=31 RepID=UPI00129C8E66|nr:MULTISPECIES: hypothetical protein [Myxococcaceae]MBF5042181.1 hypothetical protein [Simulacricoccus sp. 17bor-14]MRI87958.1 hypothetical protein [Aggregicoccus sp. 17bor-14]